MSAPSPRLLEILSERHPGKQPELEKETEWTYVYKIGSKSGYKLSKFMDDSFEVSAAVLRQRWPTMNEDERLEFGFNWSSKRTWSDNDTEILEIVIEHGNDRLWTHCTSAFPRHPDRDRAVRFLVERLQNYESGHEPLNYFQALGIMKDRRAAGAIRPYYENYRRAVEAEASTLLSKLAGESPSGLPKSKHIATVRRLVQVRLAVQNRRAGQGCCLRSTTSCLEFTA